MQTTINVPKGTTDTSYNEQQPRIVFSRAIHSPRLRRGLGSLLYKVQEDLHRLREHKAHRVFVLAHFCYKLLDGGFEEVESELEWEFTQLHCGGDAGLHHMRRFARGFLNFQWPDVSRIECSRRTIISLGSCWELRNPTEEDIALSAVALFERTQQCPSAVERHALHETLRRFSGVRGPLSVPVELAFEALGSRMT